MAFATPPPLPCAARPNGRPAGGAANGRSPRPLAPAPPLRCGAPEGSASSGSGGADDAPPPPLSPSAAAAAASRLGGVGTSRYEAFYRPAAGEQPAPPALDVTAVPCVSAGGDGGGDGDAPPSNPFFVGYPQEELAALWAIHQDVVGARADAAEEDVDDDARGDGGAGGGGGGVGGQGPPGGGGAAPVKKLALHELILQALKRGEGGAATPDGESP